MSALKHSHYFKNVKHLDHIDVYRVLDLFGMTDNALGHAAKKILCAGIRGAKDQAKDVQEAIDTLERWKGMQAENHIGEGNEKVAESDKTIKFSNPSYQAWQDKELASSGIYGDAGYSEQEMQAASLVHDLDEQWDSGKLGRDEQFVKVADEPLNPDLVSLCANTTIHADEDGWIEHVGNECPVSDREIFLEVKLIGEDEARIRVASKWYWGADVRRITHWRYAK